MRRSFLGLALSAFISLVFIACANNTGKNKAPTSFPIATVVRAATVGASPDSTIRVGTTPAGSASVVSGRAQTADSAPCLQGQIKGNRNSMLYHVPGGRDYAKTTANVVCFDSEDQAKAAGYKRAQQ